MSARPQHSELLAEASKLPPNMDPKEVTGMAPAKGDWTGTQASSVASSHLHDHPKGQGLTDLSKLQIHGSSGDVDGSKIKSECPIHAPIPPPTSLAEIERRLRETRRTMRALREQASTQDQRSNPNVRVYKRTAPRDGQRERTDGCSKHVIIPYKTKDVTAATKSLAEATTADEQSAEQELFSGSEADGFVLVKKEDVESTAGASPKEAKGASIKSEKAIPNVEASLAGDASACGSVAEGHVEGSAPAGNSPSSSSSKFATPSLKAEVVPKTSKHITTTSSSLLTSPHLLESSAIEQSRNWPRVSLPVRSLSKATSSKEFANTSKPLTGVLTASCSLTEAVLKNEKKGSTAKESDIDKVSTTAEASDTASNMSSTNTPVAGELNKCAICMASFAEESRLRTHYRRVHKYAKYGCKNCHLDFVDGMLLSAHMALCNAGPANAAVAADPAFAGVIDPVLLREDATRFAANAPTKLTAGTTLTTGINANYNVNAMNLTSPTTTAGLTTPYTGRTTVSSRFGNNKKVHFDGILKKSQLKYASRSQVVKAYQKLVDRFGKNVLMMLDAKAMMDEKCDTLMRGIQISNGADSDDSSDDATAPNMGVANFAPMPNPPVFDPFFDPANQPAGNFNANGVAVNGAPQYATAPTLNQYGNAGPITNATGPSQMVGYGQGAVTNNNYGPYTGNNGAAVNTGATDAMAVDLTASDENVNANTSANAPAEWGLSDEEYATRFEETMAAEAN